AIIEIGREHLNDDPRVGRPYAFNGLAEMSRAPVGQIISRDRRDDNVPEAHSPGGLGDTRRLVRLEREGSGRCYRTKAAGARATVARNHEGGDSPAPTFPMVGALRTFANGVKLEFVEQVARPHE